MLLLLVAFNSKAQVGINTTNPHSSAALEIRADNNPKGVLIPRVNLLSTQDVTTIANPAKDLIVYNLINSGTGLNQVYANYLYVFDGTIWKRFTSREDLINNNPDLPSVVAFGRKTTTEQCTGTTTVEGKFNLNELSDGNIISNSGEFIAPKDGYYSFAAKSNIQFRGNAGQTFETGPYTYAEGLMTYVYKFRGNTNQFQDNPRTIVGTIYLTAGQKTKPFYWNLGTGNACPAIGNDNFRIKEQQVVWEYIGNP